jgi:hypothetical protein
MLLLQIDSTVMDKEEKKKKEKTDRTVHLGRSLGT